MELDITEIVFSSLVVLSVVAVICCVRRCVGIIPAAMKSLFRWKDAVQLEYNVRQCRDRNIVYFILIVPACLLLSRFLPRLPSFMSYIPPYLHAVAVIVVFIVYGLLRGIMRIVCKRKRTDSLGFSAATNLFRTAFCIFVPIMLATAGVMSLAHSPKELIMTAIFYEIVLSFIVLLWREGEILRHYCSVLTTFLYLCGLEILPALFLIILWII